MRGGKSLVVLLVLALGLGAYIYFVENKRDLSEPGTKKDKVFAVDTSKAEEIEVHAAAGDVTRLKKNGTDWQVVAPAGVDADSAAVSGLVSSLESLEMQKVLDENPASVKDYGLDPVRFSVGFKLPGESTMHTLDVGNKTPTGSDLYARVAGQPKLFLISAYVEDSINRTTFDLRDKSVLKFDRDKADGLTLEAAGSPAVTLAKKGSDWRLQAPVDARADFSAVDGLVGRLFQLQMKEVANADASGDLKAFGLDKPQLVATVGAGSTRAALAFGSAKDATTVYARDLSRPMVVVVVDKTALDDLKKKADDLRVKDIFEFRAFTAVSVDLTLAGVDYAFGKEKAPAPAAPSTPDATSTPAPDVWKMKKPTAKDVNETAMTDLLNTLSTLRADKFTDKAAPAGEDLVVSARFGDTAAPREEKVTLRKSGDTVQAIRAGEPGAAIVPTAEFDKAVKQLKDLAGSK